MNQAVAREWSAGRPLSLDQDLMDTSDSVCVDSMNTVHSEFFGKLLTAQRCGAGVLPYCLGLQPLELICLAQRYLPQQFACDIVVDNSNSQARERGILRQQLLDMRRDEWLDVRELLIAHRAGKHPLETAMASMVAAGCLGGDHLWRDLGLATRGELSELLMLFFPYIAVKNDNDMKWKKFFYKQLCEQQGGYVCRAPSCEQCAAYADCFGEEI